MKALATYTICLCFFCVNIFPQRQISINIVGEIDLGEFSRHAKNTADSVSSLFSQASSTLKNGDATFTSLANPIFDGVNETSRIPVPNLSRCIPVSYAKSLADAGFTATSASSNNIGQYGFSGVASTSEALKQSSIAFAGIKSFCEYTIIEKGDIKIGFASFGDSPHTPSITDTVKIKRILSEMNGKCDIIVVSFSIDTRTNTSRYNLKVTKTQYATQAETFAKTCINHGADIIYGCGPDTPEAFDIFNDRLIIYGIGNFCTPSNKKFGKETGCAPIISVHTHSDGSFCKAKIESFRQIGKEGPKPDKENHAYKIIKEKTEQISPEHKFIFNDEGYITPSSKSPAALITEILDEGASHIGKRYKRGTQGPTTFDCSGLTGYLFSKIGINLHRTAESQYTQGIKVSKDSLQAGDLVFFQGSASRRIGHVGIIVSVDKENRSFKFLHASNRGVTIDDFAKSSYYIRRYVGATRVIGHKTDSTHPKAATSENIPNK